MKQLFLIVCTCAALAAQTKPAAAHAKAPAKPAAPKVSAFDKTTLENYVRHLYVWPPPIKIEIADPTPGPMPGFLEVKVKASNDQGASQEESFYVSKDGQKILRGQVFDVAQNPFKSDLDKLKTDFRPSEGTPGASVVLVEFSDFECPHCREEAKILHDNLLREYPTQVRLYFMDFPIEIAHPWARAAADAGQCIFKQKADLFWQYHDWIFEHQNEVTPDNLKDKVLEFAKGKDIDALQLARCMDTKAADPDVEKTIAMAKSLQINATPTIFVNGRRLVGAVEWNALKRVIDYELDYQKTAKNAGENCGCDVSIPTIGFK